MGHQETVAEQKRKKLPAPIIGLDIGSVSIKAAIMDTGLNPIWSAYERHKGQPLQKALSMLAEAVTATGTHTGLNKPFLAITGSAGKTVAKILDVPFTNEITAQAAAMSALYPHIRTIIEMGGEDAKLIILENGAIADFALSSACAAGTGSFLEQQAERLNLTIGDFSRMASATQKPARIAGRCSVFAKSDMIHLQQIATPLENIVAGLCFAVARNFKSSIARGRNLRTPVAFQGGVAANSGMVRAFKEVFRLDEIFVPEKFALTGAIGTAIKEATMGNLKTFDIDRLGKHLAAQRPADHAHAPLIAKEDQFHERHTMTQKPEVTHPQARAHTTAYLGVDIGSISTNLAIIDDQCRVISKCYIMTAGRPIEAVKQGLRQISSDIGHDVNIAGVGTTGSGRYMIADYIGADIVKNEITAQATAAIFIDKDVDTIFEIGGQDSKYISLKKGVITDFEMNKACAAGTGSFLEEQAEKLDISVKGEFQKLALRAEKPSMLGERCTVFMENSLMASLQRGTKKENLLSGLAYSIVQNYINRVVCKRPIGNKIFFQGGVAYNKSVVAAFEKYLGKEVIVPEYHDVTGAIGMALIAKRNAGNGNSGKPSAFKGFGLSSRPYEMSSFECGGCPNVCEINKVTVKDEKKPLYYGGRCEKYDCSRQPKTTAEDLFDFREAVLTDAHGRHATQMQDPAKKTIGIPRVFFFHEFLPYWTTLIWNLGFNVKLSPPTNKETIRAGAEVSADTCFPIKAAHGHIATLIDSGVDAIFLPSFVSLVPEDSSFENAFSCPLTQSIPYSARLMHGSQAFITPPIHHARGENAVMADILKHLKPFGVTKKALQRAAAHAESEQIRCQQALKAKGDQILGTTKNKAIVIVGRPYNALDRGMNLDIPKKLRQLGVTAIPMDFIRTKDAKTYDKWPGMYWGSGQKILAAAETIAAHPMLYPIYIGNFLCGPDSFILKYFQREMGTKPHLGIEIDEHTADAGIMTRCEAFLDSIASRDDHHAQQQAQPARPAEKTNGKSPMARKKIYIPNMADHAILMSAAFRKCGIGAEAMPEPDHQSIELGKRHLSGKECYPCLLTAGDMIKCASKPDFLPQETAFMMPSGSGPCRFGQYNVFHRMILEDIGHHDIPIISPTQDWRLYKEVASYAKNIPVHIWHAIVAADTLTKHLHQARPYETCPGSADALYEKHLALLVRAIEDPRADVHRAVRDMSADFARLPKDGPQKPLIGIIGEIYVRSNRFANDNFIRKIEKLGAEARLSPIAEWFHYIGFTNTRRAMYRKDIATVINILIKRHIQSSVENRYLRACSNTLRDPFEHPMRNTIREAAPFIHDSLEGEATLSIGKSIEMAKAGMAGIVNLMPFGCMPGNIVAAVLKHITQTYGTPHMNMAYDGTESPVTQIQTEAFIEQAKAYHSELFRRNGNGRRIK